MRIAHNLARPQLAAVLAGLAVLAATPALPLEIEEIATDGDSYPLYDADQIEDLRERLTNPDAPAEQRYPMRASLDGRQKGAVLAGLRLYERMRMVPADVRAIASANGQIEPLAAEDIDELCQNINFAHAAESEPA